MTFIPKWKNRVEETRKTYNCWKNMRQRCYNSTAVNYPQYGGRGITICDQWKENYDAFVEDMGLKPEGSELDRIENEGPYSPDNCRWVSHKENCQNRRSTRYLHHDGQARSWRAWAEHLGINRETFARYARHGMTVAEIQSLKIQSYRRKTAQFDL